MNAMAIRPGPLTLLRWTGRLLAALLFLFWGSFFVEHLVEWFVRPWPQTPPPIVWFAQGLHLLMLAGLVLLWRWELVGGVLVVAASFAFFVDKAGGNFPLFFGATSLPALISIWCGWCSRAARSRGVGGDPSA